MRTPTRFAPPASGARCGFEPTFPLDKVERERRLAAAKLSHPLTWMVPGLLGLGTIAAAPLLPIPVAMMLTAVASVLWVRASWRKLDNTVRARVEREMIDESNRRQNELMEATMRGFRSRGAGHYAAVLANFLREKRRCESCIGSEDAHFSTVEKMENLVDGLCSGACRELDKLIRLDRGLADVLVSRDAERLEGLDSRRRRHLETVFDAYSVLADGAEMLDEAKGMRRDGGIDTTNEREATIPAAGSRGDELRRAIEELRDETAITSRVRERLDTVSHDDDGATAERGLVVSG